MDDFEKLTAFLIFEGDFLVFDSKKKNMELNIFFRR